MTNCNTHIEIHGLPGKTQASGFPTGLGADFVLLDERKIEHLMVSTIQLSKHIQFYGPENVIDGNWSSFFSWEPTSLFAELSTLNVQALQRELKLKVRKLLFIADEGERKSEMQAFFQTIQDQLRDYHAKMAQLPEDIGIKEYYLSFYVRVDELVVYIINQIDLTIDTLQLFNDHLFNKQIRNLFGMLTELKTKSAASFQEHIDTYPKHSPQYALFLTFLKLFSEAQHEANKFTQRHLDFYYKKVLNLEVNAAEPDYVHCTVQPHKNVEPFLLEKGSILLAGKTDNGKAKYFETTADLAVNQAKIHQVFGSFLNKVPNPDQYYFHDFTDVITAGEAWKPFTKHTVCQNIGLAFASPLLFLKGGDRTIKLTFNNGRKNDKYQKFNENFNVYLTAGNNQNWKENFKFYLTAEKEWVEVEERWMEVRPYNDVMKDIDVGSIITIALPSDVPPIIPFNPEFHDGVVINTTFPVLKIIANNGQLLQQKFKSYKLEVEVTNYKEFSLFSDFGEIDHSKKFEAFGPIPRKESSIYFSSNEFFQKRNAIGKFKITMDNNRWIFFKNSKINILKNGKWISDLPNKFTNNNVIDTSEYTYGENPNFDKSSANSFVRVQLDKEDFIIDADSTERPYLENFIEAAKNKIVNLPYLPIITDFNFGYSADSRNNEIQAFHLYPNGFESVTLNKLLPELRNEGELIIGIKDVKAGQPLSLLIQVEEGTADPTLEATEIQWNYLDQNSWSKFDQQTIGDETNGLLQSGIVFLKVPDDFQFTGQTMLPAGIFWLRIAVPLRTAAVCNLVGLHIQAFKAVLTDYEETGVEFTKHLEPKTISKLLRPKNQIKKIEQPYTSFGGRTGDTDEDFYKRTSERLRHRARAISKWDYETLVLDEFPQVYRVKCLPHFQVKSDTINNTSAGNVTVVPVATSTNENLPVAWRPLVDLGTMKRIKTFLQGHATPHVKIDVIPPNLEDVIFSFQVKYHESINADARLYQENLNQIINAYLSPWAYETPENVQFQNEIYISKLIQIIESQSFVDYIFDFKAKHYDDDLSDAAKASKSFKSMDKIVPFTDYSLFLPGEHLIVESKNVCCT